MTSLTEANVVSTTKPENKAELAKQKINFPLVTSFDCRIMDGQLTINSISLRDLLKTPNNGISALPVEVVQQFMAMEKLFIDNKSDQIVIPSPRNSNNFSESNFLNIYTRDKSDPSRIKALAIEHKGNDTEFANFVKGVTRGQSQEVNINDSLSLFSLTTFKDSEKIDYKEILQMVLESLNETELTPELIEYIKSINYELQTVSETEVKTEKIKEKTTDEKNIENNREDTKDNGLRLLQQETKGTKDSASIIKNQQQPSQLPNEQLQIKQETFSRSEKQVNIREESLDNSIKSIIAQDQDVSIKLKTRETLLHTSDSKNKTAYVINKSRTDKKEDFQDASTYSLTNSSIVLNIKGQNVGANTTTSFDSESFSAYSISNFFDVRARDEDIDKSSPFTNTETSRPDSIKSGLSFGVIPQNKKVSEIISKDMPIIRNEKDLYPLIKSFKEINYAAHQIIEINLLEIFNRQRKEASDKVPVANEMDLSSILSREAKIKKADNRPKREKEKNYIDLTTNKLKFDNSKMNNFINIGLNILFKVQMTLKKGFNYFATSKIESKVQNIRKPNYSSIQVKLSQVIINLKKIARSVFNYGKKPIISLKNTNLAEEFKKETRQKSSATKKLLKLIKKSFIKENTVEKKLNKTRPKIIIKKELFKLITKFFIKENTVGKEYKLEPKIKNTTSFIKPRVLSRIVGAIFKTIGTNVKVYKLSKSKSNNKRKYQGTISKKGKDIKSKLKTKIQKFKIEHIDISIKTTLRFFKANSFSKVIDLIFLKVTKNKKQVMAANKIRKFENKPHRAILNRKKNLRSKIEIRLEQIVFQIIQSNHNANNNLRDLKERLLINKVKNLGRFSISQGDLQRLLDLIAISDYERQLLFDLYNNYCWEFEENMIK